MGFNFKVDDWLRLNHGTVTKAIRDSRHHWIQMDNRYLKLLRVKDKAQ